ncbi:MFS transporter [Acidisphaera sp. S103]|uniref:MFS transporter n=1 Tax=Acidisphaera sp. S103 TaxID=1747223 RepID=UPI00131D5E8D|nr:MFS transporter [Acidisphaera sp. S103]
MSAIVDTGNEPVEIGSLEERYRQSAAFRAASDQTRVTSTHWHIAVANGLGWGFDGMDGVIMALASPLLIKEFGLSVPDYRSGLQIALLVGILGMFVWPWLADRYGRRTLLALNIALFSLMMPVLALTTTWAAFVAVRCIVNFALNGEWSLGSMLVAETWPAHLRGRIVGISRGTWCFGAALAGAIATYVIAGFGWRFAFMVPAVVSVIAVYVRAKCPESPYWVRMQDRKARITRAKSEGMLLSPADREWAAKARRIPISQLFLPDMRRNTGVATFIACCSTTIYGTVGNWMPLYLSHERHWSTAMYGKFYIWWGLIGFLGLLASGWISDRFGRRPAFYVMLAEGAVFITLWVFAKTDTELWIYGLLWGIGFLGFWAPSMILTAEVYPTRIRGVGNGFSWSVAWLFGFVLWPFLAVGLQQHTGSFAAAFLLIPVAMACMALGVWWFTPDHAGRELDQIAT